MEYIYELPYDEAVSRFKHLLGENQIGSNRVTITSDLSSGTGQTFTMQIAPASMLPFTVALQPDMVGVKVNVSGKVFELLRLLPRAFVIIIASSLIILLLSQSKIILVLLVVLLISLIPVFFFLGMLNLTAIRSVKRICILPNVKPFPDEGSGITLAGRLNVAKQTLIRLGNTNIYGHTPQVRFLPDYGQSYHGYEVELVIVQFGEIKFSVEMVGYLQESIDDTTYITRKYRIFWLTNVYILAYVVFVIALNLLIFTLEVKGGVAFLAILLGVWGVPVTCAYLVQRAQKKFRALVRKNLRPSAALES